MIVACRIGKMLIRRDPDTKHTKVRECMGLLDKVGGATGWGLIVKMGGATGSAECDEIQYAVSSSVACVCSSCQ